MSGGLMAIYIYMYITNVYVYAPESMNCPGTSITWVGAFSPSLR